MNNMNKKILIAAITSLSLLSTAAFADVIAQSGVYGTLAGGYAFPSSPSATNAEAASSSNKNYVGTASVGYDYAFTQNWLAGLELGYLYLGQVEYSNPNGNLRTTGAQALATGTYLDSSGFNGFVKAGAIDEYSKGPSTGPDMPLQSGNTAIVKWLPAAAIGIGYMPMQNLNVALQYEYTFGSNWNVAGNNNSVTKPMTESIVTLGLTYKFPLGN